MLGRLGLILLLYFSTIFAEDTEFWDNEGNKCVCNNVGQDSFINNEIEELREKRQVSADDLISEISSLLGNNTNITATLAGLNLTTANLTQILEDVTSAVTNQTTNTTASIVTSTSINTTVTVPTTLATTTPTSTTQTSTR